MNASVLEEMERALADMGGVEALAASAMAAIERDVREQRSRWMQRFLTAPDAFGREFCRTALRDLGVVMPPEPVVMQGGEMWIRP